jgi:hypothetical protein
MLASHLFSSLVCIAQIDLVETGDSCKLQHNSNLVASEDDRKEHYCEIL